MSVVIRNLAHGRLTMDQTLALALLLIGAGLLLLLCDLFFYSGFIAVVALILIVAGVAVPFYYGNTSTGVVTLLGVVVAVPALIYGMLQYTTRSRAGLMLPAAVDDDATVAAMPVIAELEQLRGRIGRAVSPLRPSGTVEFDGRRIDVLTEGILVDEGTWVRCIDVKAGRVVVRPVDKPNLADLENADFT